MEGSLVGFGVLATVAVTVYTLVRYARRPVSIGRVLLGVLISLVIVSIFFPVFIGHYGSPFPVLLITALCCGLAFTIRIEDGRWLLGLMALTLCMMIALPWYAMTLCDGKRYIGDGHRRQQTRYSLNSHLERVTVQDGASYPAGWLAEMPFAGEIPTYLFWGRRFTPHPCWHSVFTGLYRAEVTPIAAWWPGGDLAEEWWLRVEYRPREAPGE